MKSDVAPSRTNRCESLPYLGRQERLRIATWNLREGRTISSSSLRFSHKAIEDVVRLLKEMEIDVIALQEVDFLESDSRSRILQALTAQTELSNIASMTLSQSSFDPANRAGIAIAARFPITSARESLFPNPSLPLTWEGQTSFSFDKGAISCTMRLDAGVDVRIISIHMFPFHRFGRKAGDSEMLGIWANLDSLIGEQVQPVIMAGDFNTDQRGLISAVASGAMHRAIGSLPTHNGKATDDIVFSGHFKQIGRPSVVENFSDHHLCIADLSLAPAELGTARFEG